MRQAKRLLIVLLAAACIAGCAEDERAPQKRFAAKIDEARRLYKGATALLANPTYVDTTTGLTYAAVEKVTVRKGGPYTGTVTRTEKGDLLIKELVGTSRTVALADVEKIEPHKTPGSAIKLATSLPASSGTLVALAAANVPDVGADALGKLDAARAKVLEAIAETPDVPAGMLADARQLLGQIELARGEYHALRAARLVDTVAAHRNLATDLLTAAESNASLATFHKSLANMPQEKITALGAKLAATRTQVSGKIAAATSAMTKGRKATEALAKENTRLRAQAKGLRDRSNVTAGQEGLDLLRDAHKVERVINANDANIAARMDRMGNLKVDQDMLANDLKAIQFKSKAVTDRLADMAKRASKATADMQTSRKASSGSLNLAGAAAEKVAGASRLLLAEEGKALAAYEASNGFVKEAVEGVKAERREAKGTEAKQESTGRILDELGSDGHLASMVALRASTSLAMADIRRRQIDTATSNAALAAKLEATSTKLGQPAPAVAGELREYVDAADARGKAVANYKEAQGAMDGLLTGGLKDGQGDQIRWIWIYEGHLASAYFGHYQLTGDVAVLDNASKFVDKALAKKEGSPYLDTVKQLKGAIDAAKGGGDPAN